VKYATGSRQNERLVAVLFITIIMVILFSSINFLVSRYIFLLIPLVILYLCYYCRLSYPTGSVAPYTWVAMIFIISIYSAYSETKNMGDDSPEYVEAIKLQEKMVRYMEEQNLQNKSICCQRDVLVISLTNKGSGYLAGGSVFSNINGVLQKNTEYVLYANIDFDPPFCFTEEDTLPPSQLVKTFSYGIAKGELFKRNL
jgi:hypothetical protein